MDEITEKRPRVKDLSYTDKIIQSIEVIKDKTSRLLAEEVIEEAKRKADIAVPVLANMIPEAVMTIYDIIRNGNKEDTVRLKAATWLLGVFGISDKKPADSPTDKNDDKESARLTEELINEFTRKIRLTRPPRKTKNIIEIEAGPVPGESGGSEPGSSGI